MELNQRILAELSDLEARAQLRSLEFPHGVDLNSNDYLGLSTHPRIKQAVLEGVNSATRMGSTGSRLLSGHDEAWDLVEREFARWAGADAALYFTSGYAANVGLLGAVLRAEDVVFSDSANHASLIDGIRLSKCRRVVFPHLDLNFLEDELRHSAPVDGARVIVVESIFSMEGDRAPLGNLAALASRYGAELIVDEAHATGVRGPHGSGCVAEAGLSAKVLATVHTCGKALAAAGAFVCGSENLRRFLINRARTFIFSTALPPYFASQVAIGMNLAEEADGDREHLARLGIFLRDELRANGFEPGGDSQIVPVILGSNEVAIQFADYLRARGFGVRAIRPPTVPAGTARLRLSVTSKLSKNVLAELVAALVQARAEFPAARALSVSP
ncbi:MAG TPA: 8-amino-7-oxononanoate synthase [Verrucomicrobiae bacterium]|nr:8-amino-7-oxononanoate synthase [Verrucomicrobiae bacterium]